MAKKSFAVLGIGQFGFAVVEELSKHNNDIIVIDNNMEVINKVAQYTPTAFIADSTDINALKELGVQDVDYAIVAYGGNKQASILTTVALSQLNIPHIVVRADDDEFIPVAKKIGATEVITPQKSAGLSFARRVGTDEYIDYHKLDDTYAVVSMIVHEDFVPTTLMEADTKSHSGVSIVLINRDGKSFVPRGNDEIKANDILYVVGTPKQTETFRKSITKNKK